MVQLKVHWTNTDQCKTLRHEMFQNPSPEKGHHYGMRMRKGSWWGGLRREVWAEAFREQRQGGCNPEGPRRHCGRWAGVTECRGHHSRAPRLGLHTRRRAAEGAGTGCSEARFLGAVGEGCSPSPTHRHRVGDQMETGRSVHLLGHTRGTGGSGRATHRNANTS